MASDLKGDSTSLVSPPEGVFIYVAVKGSLYSADCAVFGLSNDESNAMKRRYPGGQTQLVNGIHINGHVLRVINSLSELGYVVVASTGEAEITWTMRREV